ncbi:AAA family ATPase [uncultured Sphingomonas sp.]|uniref:AAA family ATPase n=1 Tax=uncultured Sphingomonas sp. TaxID=158754 RepID=UPI0025F2B136|nr:ATP-binding protein [uncultured Sphingomonas sp.]
MNIKHVKLKNWRNFQTVDVPLADTTYILGANASGKSNFLDVFRFLRDISKREGGGLQKAILDRGGISKLRCLHTRQPQISIEVDLVSPTGTQWSYALEFKSEGKGAQRILVSKEDVYKDGRLVLARPNADDARDPTRRTQTHLEQIQANEEFRDLAEFFSETTYLHLVPQLLKYGQQIGGQVLEDDPFGQGFLERIARAQSRSRDSRLSKIQKVLHIAVPQFEELEFEQDRITGRPHLKARFKHFRPNAGWQREEQFSDGTLRLLGLLWSLLDSPSLLLMEEPELSLNASIVAEIPTMMSKIQRQSKRRRQVLISTHSEALLSNPGIDASGVLLVEPGENGSTIREVNVEEENAIRDGFSIAEVVLPIARPSAVSQLSLGLE